MSLLRRAFAREACECTDKLRTLSNTALRRRLRFPTLESVTRMRRLKWYQSMLARQAHHNLLGNIFWFFRLGKDRGFWTERVSHSRCSACSQTTCWRFDEIPSFLARLRLGMGSNVSQARFLGYFRVQQFKGGDSFVRSGGPSLIRAFFQGCAGIQTARSVSPTRVGMFLHKTRVPCYRSPKVVHFKGNVCPKMQVFYCHREVGE